MSLSRSLDLPALDRVDTLAQELALLQDKGKRRIAILGSRHVPVVAIHLVELIARSLAQEGHTLLTSGSQGVNAAVIRGVVAVDRERLTVLLPQSLDRQVPEIRDQLDQVLHLIEKPEHDDLPLPIASSLCNQEIINRCDQLICLAFHDSETLLASCRSAEDMGKV
nr:DNA recombination-mediator protein A [Cyanobacteriota bacterium]